MLKSNWKQDGKTPLDVAVENKSVECTRILRDFIDAKKLKPPHQDRLLMSGGADNTVRDRTSGVVTDGRMAYRNVKPPVDIETEECSTSVASGIDQQSYYRCKDESSFYNTNINNKTYSNVKTSTFDESNFECYLASESSCRPPQPAPPSQPSPSSHKQQQQQKSSSHHQYGSSSSSSHVPLQYHQEQARATRMASSSTSSSSSSPRPRESRRNVHDQPPTSRTTKPPAYPPQQPASSVNVNELESLISNLIDIKLQEKTASHKIG